MGPTMITIPIKRSWESLLFSFFIFNAFMFASGVNRYAKTLQPQGKGMFTKRPYIEWPPQDSVDSIPNRMPQHDYYPSCETFAPSCSMSKKSSKKPPTKKGKRTRQPSSVYAGPSQSSGKAQTIKPFQYSYHPNSPSLQISKSPTRTLQSPQKVKLPSCKPNYDRPISVPGMRKSRTPTKELPGNISDVKISRSPSLSSTVELPTPFSIATSLPAFERTIAPVNTPTFDFHEDTAKPANYPMEITADSPSYQSTSPEILPSMPNFKSNDQESPAPGNTTNFPSKYPTTSKGIYTPAPQITPIYPTKGKPTIKVVSEIPVLVESSSPEKSSKPSITYPEIQIFFNTTPPTSFPFLTSTNSHLPIHNISVNPTPVFIPVTPTMKPTQKYMNPTTRLPSDNSSSNQIELKSPENSFSQSPLSIMSPQPFSSPQNIPITNDVSLSPAPSQIKLTSRNPVNYAVTTSVPPYFTDMGKCVVDQNGFFGSSDHSIAIIVRFKYELEINPNSSFKYGIANLERTFNNFLLPVLFPENCNLPMMNINTYTSIAIGISLKPDDAILSSLDCAQQKSAKNKCQVIQGGLTIFIDDVANSPNTIFSVVLANIKEGMTNSTFLSPSKGIERVAFWTQSEISGVESESENPQNEGQITSAHSLVPLVLGVIAALIALALVITFLLWKNRRGERVETDPDERQNSNESPSAQANVD